MQFRTARWLTGDDTGRPSAGRGRNLVSMMPAATHFVNASCTGLIRSLVGHGVVRSARGDDCLGLGPLSWTAHAGVVAGSCGGLALWRRPVQVWRGPLARKDAASGWGPARRHEQASHRHRCTRLRAPRLVWRGLRSGSCVQLAPHGLRVHQVAGYQSSVGREVVARTNALAIPSAR